MTSSVSGGEALVFDCREAVRRLWDYLDRELVEIEVVAVDVHLRECDRCPGHFEFERAFLAAVHAARDERVASAKLRDRVRAILGLSDQAE